MASLELNKQSCPEHVLKWIENGGQIHYVTSLHRQSTASFNYQKVYENSSESRLVSFDFRDFVISILGTFIESIFYIVLHSVLHRVSSSSVVSSIEDPSRDPLTARSGDQPVRLGPRFTIF